MSTRPYVRRPNARSRATRRRINDAVRELLAEGSFHTSTMEEVAERAGVSRATLYQHFGSRLDLVDAVCEGFAENPALARLRETVELPDADKALDETIANTVAFWSSEHDVLRNLYDVAAVDPAAQELVERQRDDRRGEYERLVRTLARAGRLGVPRTQALTVLLLLSSYDAYRELRDEGLSDRRATALLQDSARRLLSG
jgi:AcrR family transcriptional regulator